MASPNISKRGRFQLACPYFMPVAKLENGAFPHPARLPLGGGWRGHCTAPGHEGQSPEQAVLESCCNLGYASTCSWSPGERAWDAIRFAVSAPADFTREKSLKDVSDVAGRTLRLKYVCERKNLPVSHGELQFDLVQAFWVHKHEDLRVQRMAECFLESYLKKKA
jgi:hypothetical protein